MPAYLYDLHVHTRASDGGYTPEALVRMAFELGMAAVAITDHDTTASNAAGVESGEELGLKVIPGIELTTSEGYHILGYFVNSDEGSGLASYLAGLRARALVFMADVLYLLKAEHGIEITDQELARRTRGGIPNMAHLLDILFKRGEIDEIAFDSKVSVALFGDPDYMVNFFRKFARTRPFTDAAGAVRMIVSSGGAPVWAHPMNADPAEVARLKDLGLAGLEVTTRKHDQAMRRSLRALCAGLDLIPTGGTDYHGRYFDSIEKGLCLGAFGVEKEIVERLEEAASRKQSTGKLL